MTRAGAVRASSPLTGARIVVVAVPLVLAFLLARVLVGAPLSTLLVLVGAFALVQLLLHVEWCALLFVAAEPFEDYVRSVSASAVKALGAILVLAWVLNALSPTRRRAAARPAGQPRALEHPVGICGIAMITIALASTVVHPNGSTGFEVLTRYLSFLGAMIVLIDLFYTGLPVRRVVTVFVASCGAAAAIGLFRFVSGAATRAGGPLGDPNDFAFFMVAALPLALVLRRLATGRRAYLWDVTALLLLGAMVATLSRGALFAVLAMIIYAIATGVVRFRVVAAIFSLLVVALVTFAVTDPAIVDTALSQKQFVATQNVDDRLIRWRVAAEMTVDDPIVGIGPGGFRTEYDRYVDLANSGLIHDLDVAHETYLEVSAELGLLGLAAFLGVLGYGFAGAYRRSREPDGTTWLAGAVCASLIGTAVAAIFLTEQYYLPLWLLAAFGAAMDPKYRVGRGPEPVMPEDDVTMRTMTRAVQGTRGTR